MCLRSVFAASVRHPYHRRVPRIPEARPVSRGLVVVLPLPAVAGAAPMDVAEAFRDLPGLALLESARPGRTGRWSFLTADPVAVLDAPSEGPDPFAESRVLLARLATGTVDGLPPFAGGLVGYLGYDLGRRFERLPSIARVDQHLPVVRLGLYDWAIAWDRRTATGYLGVRAVDGDRVAQMRLELARRILDTKPCGCFEQERFEQIAGFSQLPDTPIEPVAEAEDEDRDLAAVAQRSSEGSGPQDRAG